MSKKGYITLKLTSDETRQLICSLENDWIDNDNQSCAAINRMLKKVAKLYYDDGDPRQKYEA
jgi:hypothetical protein